MGTEARKGIGDQNTGLNKIQVFGTSVKPKDTEGETFDAGISR
jgi:hypothetical protein